MFCEVCGKALTVRREGENRGDQGGYAKEVQLQVYTDASSSTGNPEISKQGSYIAMDLIYRY